MWSPPLIDVLKSNRHIQIVLGNLNLNFIVIFVDFDGVLHRLGEEAFDEHFNLIKNANLFCWRSILEDLLEPHPAVRIIVSSDWRRLFGDEALMRLLGRDLGQRFVGVVETYNSSRAAEIIVDASRRKLDYWLAVDDDPSVLEARRQGDQRFVGCSSDTGLSAPVVQREIRLKLAHLVSVFGSRGFLC